MHPKRGKKNHSAVSERQLLLIVPFFLKSFCGVGFDEEFGGKLILAILSLR